jgi:hypothetical protein
LLILSRFVNKHGQHRQFLFLIGRFLLCQMNGNGRFLLCQMNGNLVGSIYGRSSIQIAKFPPSVNKHGCHRQFLFQVGRFLKIFPHWNCLAKWTATWWEAPMEGSVLSFLKTEWNVSDTCCAHWASSFFSIFRPFLSCFRPALE